MIALLKKTENSRILNFVKSPKITNSRKFKHAKITRSTLLVSSLNFQSLEAVSRYRDAHLQATENSLDLRDSRPTAHTYQCFKIKHTI